MKKTKKRSPRINWKAAAVESEKQNAELWAENKKLRENSVDKVIGYAAQDTKAGQAVYHPSRTFEPLVLVLSVEEQNSKILLAAFHTFKRCLEKLKKKNSDYAQKADEFSNFKDEELQVVFDGDLQKGARWYDTTAMSIRVLIKTKMKRYLNLTAKGLPPQNESLSDTREDLVNYLVIDKAWEDRY